MIDFLKTIYKNSRIYQEKKAIVICDKSYTYKKIIQYALNLSLKFSEQPSSNNICVILSKKTNYFYVGMLACFFSNKIYTPLNIHQGMEKSKQIIKIINPDIIFVGDIDWFILDQFILDMTQAIILFSDKIFYRKCQKMNLKNTLYYVGDCFRKKCDFNVDKIYLASKNYAYLFFTSGSTGAPKGVPISYQNLNAYISSVLSIFSFNADDRFIQLSDIAFDISIHEIIVCLTTGATLYIYDEKNELSIARFIYHNKITQCILVPSSMPVIIDQCKFYQCHFDTLKQTLICGEAFPLSFAKAWTLIAPTSAIVNLYGPTEATVCCAYHHYQKENDYGSLLTVPIGHPFPNTMLSVSNDHELIITGDQVSDGYWLSDKKLLKQFKYDTINQKMSYFTGDIVHYHTDFGFIFQGRRDDQWQVSGYRVEKNEVESVLRHVLDIADIYIVPHYNTHQLIHSLIAFSTVRIDIASHKKNLSAFLPEPVIPEMIIQLEQIPRLPNKKINYRKLLEILYERSL